MTKVLKMIKGVVRSRITVEGPPYRVAREIVNHLKSRGHFVESGYTSKTVYSDTNFKPYYYIINNCGDNCIKVYADE